MFTGTFFYSFQVVLKLMALVSLNTNFYTYVGEGGGGMAAR